MDTCAAHVCVYVGLCFVSMSTCVSLEVHAHWWHSSIRVHVCSCVGCVRFQPLLLSNQAIRLRTVKLVPQLTGITSSDVSIAPTDFSAHSSSRYKKTASLSLNLKIQGRVVVTSCSSAAMRNCILTVVFPSWNTKLPPVSTMKLLLTVCLAFALLYKGISFALAYFWIIITIVLYLLDVFGRN